MKTEDHDSPAVEGLLGNVCNSDVPPDVEQRLKTQLAAFRGRLAEREALGRSPASVTTRPRGWRRVVRPRWIAAAAAAAVVMIGLGLCWHFLLGGGTPLTLAQIVEANRWVTTLHVKLELSGQGTSDLWAQFDETGKLEFARLDYPDGQVLPGSTGPGVAICRPDAFEVWDKTKNVVTVLPHDLKVANALEQWRQKLDPKEATERLYRAQADGQGDIHIEQPAAKGEPIKLTYTTRGDAQTCEVYSVDPETKLVTRIDIYRVVGQGRHELQVSAVIAAYNQPIDPAIFAPAWPAGVTRTTLHEETPTAQPTNLSPEQAKEAVAVLKAERLRWYKVKEFSGEVTITLQRLGANPSAATVTGTLSVVRVDLPPGKSWRGARWAYHYELTNSVERWKVVCNESSNGAHFTSEGAASPLEDSEWAGMFGLVTEPRDNLVALYKDDLFPEGLMTLDELIRWKPPFVNPDAGGFPSSYVFRHVDDKRTSQLNFVNGVFTGNTRKGDGRELAITCRGHTGGADENVAFPTEIEITARNSESQISIVLSNVSVRD